ncbi:MAG: hypothetical protein M0Z48_01460 [Nitrospiraceae bacterium]|nr:hypothetical protein [Nitrospiraceae bacterium]
MHDSSNVIIAAIIGAIVSGGLIILNEWVKRFFQKRHEKKKFKLWRKIFNEGIMGKVVIVEKKEDPPDLLYELHKDGVIIFGEVSGSGICAYAKGFEHRND